MEYSIIIPHHNIPALLQRCLDSIPPRDDIQVIVVDDNSDADIVDFESFPQWRGVNYETIFSRQTLTAGEARNRGIEHAKGKWLVFADADDVFTSQADDILERFRDRTEDVILFGIHYDDAASPDKSHNENWYLQNIRDDQDDPRRSPRETLLRLTTPWAKFFKSSLIREQNIRFDKRQHHNDTIFVTMAALKAKSVSCSFENVLYVWTFRKESLSNEKSKSKALDYLYTESAKFSLVSSEGFHKSLPKNYWNYRTSFERLDFIEQLPLFWRFLKSGMVKFHSDTGDGLSTFWLTIRFFSHSAIHGIHNLFCKTR